MTILASAIIIAALILAPSRDDQDARIVIQQFDGRPK
jgi:hypothetical protein